MNTSAEYYVRSLMLGYVEEDYRAFNIRALATVKPESVIGVRTPYLRVIAKEVFKSYFKNEFLSSLPHETYEENQIHGFLIELEKDRDRVINLLDDFLPYVDNWSTCDCVSPKVFKKNPPDIDLIHHWMSSEHTYTCRYGMGMLMRYYRDDLFSVSYLDDVAAVSSNEYYINMMRAWFFATALAKQYEPTLPVFEEYVLDTWTHNKAIQKAKESFRVSEDHKKYLDSLRIKAEKQ